MRTSTFKARRAAILRSGRRIKRYRKSYPVADDGNPSRGFHAILVTFVILPILGVLCITSKGHGVKTWLFHHTGITPMRPVIPLASGLADPSIQFDKIALPATSHLAFTCVQVGPDHRLYASVDDGRIIRYTIEGDGTLGAAELIDSLQRSQGARLISGFCFDPSSTAGSPVVWVSHGFYAFHDAPDFTGKISRLSGANLQIVQDVVVGLPRSVRDHLNNQPSFGPDGALYFPQGSNSATGAADTEWGMRNERLLNASILRLDVNRVMPGAPLDVTTADGGGKYDPYAAGAPLTIYASGVRNAFDLVWTREGQMYVPVNGSSIGGNTPSARGVPSIQSVSQTEDDWLFRIVEGGYYGHPNPRQGHFVLNGGNPGNRHNTSVVTDYPIGVQPDSQWVPPALDFGPHVSANGIIQYHGRAFDGKLDGKLIICRYNMGSDLICLGLDSRGNVNSIQTGIAGFTQMTNPLDLTEDEATGNIYVAEYGSENITLLRPSAHPHPISPGMYSFASVRSAPRNLTGGAEHGREIFGTTCITCHGPTGAGIPYTGANLRESKWIAEKSDDELAAFIRAGRQKNDPNSLLRLTMPAKGGNPNLDDAGLHDVVAYLRTLQSEARKDSKMDD